MIISRSNINFIRLREEHIELVRKWRNSPEITRFMEFTDHITPEKQMDWFRSVDNIYNLYFVIEYKGEKVGLINGKNVDWEKRTMESGVFYWNKDLYDSEVPIIATLIFGDLGVISGGFETYAHILRNNERAIRFNKMIGFELCEGQEDVGNQLYFMTRESYLKSAKKLRKAFYQLKGNEPIVIYLEKRDYDTGYARFMEKQMESKYLLKAEEVDGGKKLYFNIT